MYATTTKKLLSRAIGAMGKQIMDNMLEEKTREQILL